MSLAPVCGWRPSGGWGSGMQCAAGHKCLCVDMQGWNMGLRDASMSFPQSAAALDRLIDERVDSELKARAAPVAPPAHLWRPVCGSTWRVCSVSHTMACWQAGCLRLVLPAGAASQVSLSPVTCASGMPPGLGRLSASGHAHAEDCSGCGHGFAA